VTNSLKIVSSGLLVSNVSVNTGVSSSSSQVLSFSEGDMLSLGVLVALGESEIDNVDIIFSSIGVSNEEVIRLDISVDYALLVHLLDSLNHLSGNAKNSLQVKLAAALLEQIL
jgi:hypothetical protein